MVDVELIIRIDEDTLKKYQESVDCEERAIIVHGTPLSKGHGRLIDAGQCDRKLFYQQCGGADSLITAKSAFDMLMLLPTVIKADESEDNE